MSDSERVNVKRKRTSDPDDPWASLSRADLIQRCEQLEKHVKQLRNTLAKATAKEAHEKTRKIDRAGRPFDFSKHSKRHVLLKFVYLGWDYHVRDSAQTIGRQLERFSFSVQGYVVQEATSQTVEDFLFQALVKTRLIEGRTTSNYHRCGRTDRG